MSDHYGVYVCDLAKPCDRLIATRINRRSAERIARRRNASAILGWRRGQPQPPLYYVLWHADAGGSGYGSGRVTTSSA